MSFKKFIKHFKNFVMKLKICFGIASLLFLMSCKKENSVDTPIQSEKTKLLTEKEWVVLKAETNENSSGIWIDAFPFFENCEKDNRFRFKTDFNVEYHEAATACTGNTPNQVLEAVKWKFNNDESAIIIDNLEYRILQLDATKLVVISKETVAGVVVENRDTFGH
jgi:hypothetical protein